MLTLVGIGPGPSQLLTLQAVRAIECAEVIRHPEGCNPAILDHVAPDADLARYAGPEEVIQLARIGRKVAVLFAGDPYAFSEGATLAELLEQSGVDFEVVPGLILETAAPALSGIPLTLEGRSASLAVGAPGHADTAVLRLAAGWWESGISALQRHGWEADSPAALLVGTEATGQKRIVAPLGSIAEEAQRSGVSGDALLVVGPGVELTSRLDTLSRRPLHGVRILVTRPRQQASGLASQLMELGATVVEIPTIEIQPMADPEKLEQAFQRLSQTELLIFASSNAVKIFFQLLWESGRDSRALSKTEVCVVGTETSCCLKTYGVRSDLVAEEYTSEGLMQVLQDRSLKGARVLIPRAEIARDILPRLLSRRGAEVETLSLYRTLCPEKASTMLKELLAGPWVDIVTFTSSSTVSNFSSSLGPELLPQALARSRIACIGPVTAETAEELGMKVDIIAREYTAQGLAAVIVEALQNQKR